MNNSASRILTAQDLLAGGQLIHDIQLSPEILMPATESANGVLAGKVRLRPLNVHTLTLISRAGREDAGLIPLLMIKEAMVEPAVTLEQVRQMHIGLVHFLVGQINLISGLGAEGEAIAEATSTALSSAHLLLAKHFGWTPEQVSQLTPGQVAVYLAGIEKLLQLEGAQK